MKLRLCKLVVMMLVITLLSASVVLAESPDPAESSDPAVSAEQTESTDPAESPDPAAEATESALSADVVVENHIREERSAYMEPGDEYVCSVNIGAVVQDEDGAIHLLGYFMLTNFDADGTDLVLKNGSGGTELITLVQDETGAFEVADYQVTAEGSDYLESLEPLCEAVGITVDDYATTSVYNDLAYVLALSSFLKENPDYERIEYMGELRTLDELKNICLETAGYYGDWYETIAGRGTISFTEGDEPGTVKISVRWPSSAAEVATWEMTGTFTDEGTLVYEDGICTVTEYNEDGEATILETEEGQSGEMFIGPDGELYWNDSVFTRNE